jgi:hypothetical protein
MPTRLTNLPVSATWRPKRALIILLKSELLNTTYPRLWQELMNLLVFLMTNPSNLRIRRQHLLKQKMSIINLRTSKRATKRNWITWDLLMRDTDLRMQTSREESIKKVSETQSLPDSFRILKEKSESEKIKLSSFARSSTMLVTTTPLFSIQMLTSKLRSMLSTITSECCSSRMRTWPRNLTSLLRLMRQSACVLIAKIESWKSGSRMSNSCRNQLHM